MVMSKISRKAEDMCWRQPMPPTAGHDNNDNDDEVQAGA